MDIYLENTLTKEKQKFIPIQPGEVGIYMCGPTVYNYPHIGNLRTVVMNDLLRRMFEWNKYKVLQAMNITDVDDKTIRESQNQNISLHEFTQKYADIFMKEIFSLNVEKPHRIVWATEYIDKMIALIETLLEKNVAYVGKDGVYFSVEKFPHYGDLAHIKNFSKLKENSSADEYDKENIQDFALWKFKKEEDGENFWEAPFGVGRPGWHIECSAMALDIFKSTFDIHTGGEDLIFPHHTNEIAQSESATEEKFVNCWLHGAFMNVSGEKMAKSKNNFITLEDLKIEGYNPLDFRYLTLTAHYQTKLDFNMEALEASRNARRKLLRFVQDTKNIGFVQKDYLDNFTECINDNLNIPEALALAWKLVKETQVNPGDKKATLLLFDNVFGLSLSEVEEVVVPEDVQKLVKQREISRENKDWAESDKLRDEIQKAGFSVKDTENGQEIGYF